MTDDASPHGAREGRPSPGRLVAVSHQATLTGAPIMLAHLLAWIRRHTDVELRIAVMEDGPLRRRFEEAGPVTVVDRGRLGSALRLVERGLAEIELARLQRASRWARLRSQLWRLGRSDVLYLNSLASIEAAQYFQPTALRVAHVHELEVAVRLWPAEARRQFRKIPDLWIAASTAVLDMLVDELGVPADRVRVHHEFIDVDEWIGRASDPVEPQRRRAALGIPADATVVMGSGTLDWRKGPDLFVQLAAEVQRRTPNPVHFVWVGGEVDSRDWVRVHADLRRSGTPNVHFVGPRTDPAPWFAMADVFALTSREDPFPLVCLEHAALGHPIVTYRNGGIVELLEAAGPAAAAGVVDHLDVAALAARTLDLLASSRRRSVAGQELRSRVLQRHDVDVAAPGLLADLVTFGSSGGHPAPLRWS